MANPVFNVILLIIGLWVPTSAAGEPSGPASPERFELGLPVACALGETCWVANYVDVDPSEVARDFRCQPRTYNGHDGTDFAIRDLAVMARGMPVLAAAPGTVRNVRDGMEDVAVKDSASRNPIAGRECGNGVLLDHPGGWQTQYCHMRKGSLRVQQGEQVDGGTVLGLVGLSGNTEFPHLHLTVRREKDVIDPFTGRSMRAGCNGEETPLWRADQLVSYEEVALYNAGFAAGQPNIEAIRLGRREEDLVPATAPAMVLWVEIFGVQAGDRLRLRITRPDGLVLLDHEKGIERTQARRFSFAGKQLTGRAWATGIYQGEVTLTRALHGRLVTKTITRTLTVP